MNKSYEDVGSLLRCLNALLSGIDGSSSWQHVGEFVGFWKDVMIMSEHLDIKLGIDPCNDGVSMITFSLFCVGIMFCELVCNSLDPIPGKKLFDNVQISKDNLPSNLRDDM